MIKYIFAGLLVITSSISFCADFVVGQDYQILTKTDEPNTSGKTVDVSEFFSLGCPWCYRVEPGVDKWVKQHASVIHFKKVPVVFNKDWEYYAKAYYLTEVLNRPEIKTALFKAIINDKQSLQSNEAMIEFFTKQGADPETVKSAFNSSTHMDMLVKEGEILMAHYQIAAVPAFVVNHQFKTDLQMAKTEERLFAILDFLVKKSLGSAHK